MFLQRGIAPKGISHDDNWLASPPHVIPRIIASVRCELYYTRQRWRKVIVDLFGQGDTKTFQNRTARTSKQISYYRNLKHRTSPVRDKTSKNPTVSLMKGASCRPELVPPAWHRLIFKKESNHLPVCPRRTNMQAKETCKKTLKAKTVCF